MKKLMIIAFLVLLLVRPVVAQGLTYFPNETSEVTVYDFQSHSLKLGLRYPAFGGWELLYVDGILVTDFDTVDVAGGLSLNLIKLAELLGWEVYLSRNVIFGFCGGYNFSTTSFLYGLYTGLKWSW